MKPVLIPTAIAALVLLAGAGSVLHGAEDPVKPDSSDERRGLDLSRYELTPVYAADFGAPLKFVKESDLFQGGKRAPASDARHPVRPDQGIDWVLEGKAAARRVDGRLRLENTGGHLVFWNTRVFPADFLLEFGVIPDDPNRGLAIVFFSARSRTGDSIFDASLPMREGDFPKYHSGALDCYHVSYWAVEPDGTVRGTAHIRKNHGFHLVAQGRDFVTGGAGPHRVRVLKAGGLIEVETDGKLSVRWEDDGKQYGPVLRGGGFIGLRQMKHTQASEYTHFKVWAVGPIKDSSHR